jgi:hypothetical protein
MCVRREVSPDTILEEWEGWNGVETRLNSALTATGVAWTTDIIDKDFCLDSMAFLTDGGWEKNGVDGQMESLETNEKEETDLERRRGREEEKERS